MARFVLRYSGNAAPPEHAEIAAATADVKVVDRSARTMLIEGDEDAARNLASRLSGWTLHPEVQYQIPDTRKHIG
ncbi:MAG TPA: hypothetical protein VMB03_19975 [Bryobacteraceae bacterium]|nr:hypothetical protein [Bryobacteraceae bacterium]